MRRSPTVAAKQIESDGETPYDQRQCDAMVAICAGGTTSADLVRATSPQAAGVVAPTVPVSGPTLRRAWWSRRGGMPSGDGNGSTQASSVVAHTDLSLLRGGTGTAEVERLGLLSPETIRRIACDAEVVLAVDDAFGHTMFEGRSRRFPTDTQRREVWRRDRRCRFPGCANATFTDVHHIVHWTADGPTDLENLVTLCTHHHHRVHERQWQMSGNTNGILHFIGPSGR